MGQGDAGRELTATEVRVKQMRLLDLFVLHCEEQRYRYWLYAGTLLGAIRHQGFIPWDDDVDVMMPRDDWDAFCTTYPASRHAAESTLESVSTNSAYGLPFAKLCDTKTIVRGDVVYEVGVNIDVFPLDGWAPTGWQRKLQLSALARLRVALWHRQLPSDRPPLSLKYSMKHPESLLLRMLNTHQLAALITSVASMYNLKNSEDVGVLAWGTFEIFPKIYFATCSPVVFEQRILCAPAGYDEVLTIHYGDYMSWPSEADRASHHGWRAFWRSA